MRLTVTDLLFSAHSNQMRSNCRFGVFFSISFCVARDSHALHHPADRYSKISTISFLISINHLSRSHSCRRLPKYYVYKVCNYTYYIPFIFISIG